MFVSHKPRNLKIQKRHGFRRSHSLSPCKNLKRRVNARRLVAIAEKEKFFKKNCLFYYKYNKVCTGLLGGARNERKNGNITLDQARFVDSIRYAKSLLSSSKKQFWKTVACQYFGDLDVKKKKIDKLRLAWRRNEGGIREKLGKSYQDEANLKVSDTLTESATSENECKFHGDSDSESTCSNEVLDLKNKMMKTKRSRDNDEEMTEFLGSVIGSAISSIYRKHFMDQTEHQREHIKKTTSQQQDKFTSSIKKTKKRLSNLPPSDSKCNTNINVVNDLTSDDCLSYEQVKSTETEEDKFLNIPNVSGATAMSLSGSNVPSSGTFCAKLNKEVSLIQLPSAWRDLPVKNITDKSQGTIHRAFDIGYTSFFSNILKRFNPYCCWIFRKNYIKKENSRKNSSPYWRGMATCKFGDVSVHLGIENRDEGMLEIRFTGDVRHDITSAKAKRITGSERSRLIEHAWKSNQEPSKMHRDNLLGIDPDCFAAGVRTGAGLTNSTMKGIKLEAKARHQSDEHLTKSLSQLHDVIVEEDENTAINLGHTWRKFFGYIQMCSMSPEISIVLFNEASVRLYHELSRHDIIYIDATGNLFANEKTQPRLLYYAMVLRNPFPQNSPVPVAEYIASRHTADSIGMMIRKLKEREKEVFNEAVNPVLVMSDFSLAIIIACLKEFNNESLEEYFERGYRIVIGKATQEESQKTIHHVCSAHMMQIIKRHAKNLCETNYPTGSQIHIAMRFFGRLISASSLNEMKYIVNLGYVIFTTKHISAMLTEKLEKFSETINTFTTDINDEGNESDTESHQEEDIDIYDDETCNAMKNDVIGPCSIKAFWDEELDYIKKMNPIKGDHTGDINKYYMPRFFEYVVKNYLPSCMLWSNLLIGDLTRHNADYFSTANLTTGVEVRNHLADNQTNGEIEDFFKVKKYCSFKGQRHLRLDTFIGENWKDNLALQRKFIDAILKQGMHIRKPTLKKLQKLSFSVVEECPYKHDQDYSPVSNESMDQCVDEQYDNATLLPEEQWKKPSPSRLAKKKGKYLNATSKKLNFNPNMRQETKPNDKNLSTANFQQFERLVWADVSNRVHGYHSIKKEIKRMWASERKTPQKKKMDDITNHFKPVSKGQEDLTAAPHCICRQKRNTTAVPCVLCNESFHCDCVEFCTGLAKLVNTNYFCTNCIYKTFIPFADYILRSKMPASELNGENVRKLYDEFSVSGISNMRKDKNTPDTADRRIIENHTGIFPPVITNPNRGIQNTESNCWLSSTMQCLAATPLCELLEKWSEMSEATTMIVRNTARTLKRLINPQHMASSMKLEDGLVNIARSCGMTPNRKEHKDSSEFFNLLLNQIHEQLPPEGKQELEFLFKFTTLELNRCLVPTCHSLSGKTNTMWNVMLEIPSSSYTMRLQSLLWTRVYGRFSTEDDEVCNKCVDGKPVVHHCEFALSIPSTFTVTINRTTAYSHTKINTPILCDSVLNLRGIDADHFDDRDINFNLRSAILHKGPSIRFGHFVSCIFNADRTAFVYDDEAVNAVTTENLIKSNDFMTSVYMCFYARQEEITTPQCDTDHHFQPQYPRNVHWQLSKRAQNDVEQIWTYKKELFYGSDNISSYHLKTLKDGNWLSGDVINGFLNRIRHDSQLHIFSTYLYTAMGNSLRRNGGIVSNALSVNPFNYNMLMFPVNNGDHWSLLICYPNSYMLVYYDSMLIVNIEAFSRVMTLIKAMFFVHAHEFNLQRWLFLSPNNMPGQEDSSSCGVHMCMNAFIMAKDEDINYLPQDITNIRKWLVNFLIQESPVFQESRPLRNRIEHGTFEEVHVKSSDILRTISINDSPEKSVFQNIKILAQTRVVSEVGGIYMDEVDMQSNTSTTSSYVAQTPLQQSDNADEASVSYRRNETKQLNLRRRSKLKRKYPSSVYELGSPVLEDENSFADTEDAMWEYDVERGILANHSSSEVRVKPATKRTGFILWKEHHVKNEVGETKRLKKDLSDIWKSLGKKDKRHWGKRATLENKGFSFRWKNIWDEGFPEEWINFLHSIKSDAQNRLRVSIAHGTAKETNTDPYSKFRKRFYEKYNVQTWCEIPSYGTCEEMFSSFKEQCADPVLNDPSFSIKWTVVPSSVLNKIDDEFYNILNMYMVFLTRAPLGLAQLCRVVLSRQGSQVLIRLFKRIRSPKLRECLFYILKNQE